MSFEASDSKITPRAVSRWYLSNYICLLPVSKIKREVCPKNMHSIKLIYQLNQPQEKKETSRSTNPLTDSPRQISADNCLTRFSRRSNKRATRAIVQPRDLRGKKKQKNNLFASASLQLDRTNLPTFANFVIANRSSAQLRYLRIRPAVLR